MSIINTFDPCGKELIRAQDAIRPIENFPNTMIVVFSEKFRSLLLKKYEATEIGALHGGGTSHPIYQFEYKGVMMGFFTSTLGGPAAAAFLEELIALGAENFLYFGSCGALDAELTAGRLIVPDRAYRDEGLSYHYVPAADYIRVKNADYVEKCFRDWGVPCVRGGTWTTDGLYRETRANMEKRKAEGCLAVEMEVSAVQAVCDRRGMELYNFLLCGDLLDAPAWDERILNQPGEADVQWQSLLIALELARSLQ